MGEEIIIKNEDGNFRAIGTLDCVPELILETEPEKHSDKAYLDINREFSFSVSIPKRLFKRFMNYLLYRWASKGFPRKKALFRAQDMWAKSHPPILNIERRLNRNEIVTS